MGELIYLNETPMLRAAVMASVQSLAGSPFTFLANYICFGHRRRLVVLFSMNAEWRELLPTCSHNKGFPNNVQIFEIFSSTLHNKFLYTFSLLQYYTVSSYNVMKIKFTNAVSLVKDYRAIQKYATIQNGHCIILPSGNQFSLNYTIVPPA